MVLVDWLVRMSDDDGARGGRGPHHLHGATVRRLQARHPVLRAPHMELAQTFLCTQNMVD